MKQGSGTKKTMPKPISQAYSPSLGAISRIGIHENLTKAPGPACKKVGTSAPKSTVTGHPTGSQGKR